jgi:hypothetical protein
VAETGQVAVPEDARDGTLSSLPALGEAFDLAPVRRRTLPQRHQRRDDNGYLQRQKYQGPFDMTVAAYAAVVGKVF